jgi:hypothetical protein
MPETTVPNMSEDHSACRARLPALVPVDGSAVDNRALMRQRASSRDRQ